MPRGQSLYVIAVLIVAGLAGCSGKGGPTSIADPTDTGQSSTTDGSVPTSDGATPTDTGTAPPPLSDEELEEFGVTPNDTRPAVCVPPESVVKEPPAAGSSSQRPLDLNRSFEGAAHVHDEWDGKTELVIFDADVEPVTSVLFNEYPTGYGSGAGYFYPHGARVLPGATTSIFQLTWDETVPGDGRKLYWDMPGDEAGGAEPLTHAFVKSGDTYEFALNLSNADPPHFNRTTWAYWRLDSAETNNKAPAHFTWTIRRDMECLPVDPPHYAQWAPGETSRVLLDDEKAGTWRRTPAVISGGLQVPPVPRNNTVPIGTSTLRVTLTWTDAATNTPLAIRYCTPLEPCGYTNARWTNVEPKSSPSANSRVFEIPVTPELWDSPYDSTTDWSIQPVFDGPAGDSAGNFDGTAHWLIEAVK